MTAIEVLQEFVDDCESDYPSKTGNAEVTARKLSADWHDLSITYTYAKAVLAREGQEEQE